MEANIILPEMSFLVSMIDQSPVKNFRDHNVITDHARDHGRDHSFNRDHAFEVA